MTTWLCCAGGVFLALGLPALGAPAAGHLADRVRRRPLLLWTNALTMPVLLRRLGTARMIGLALAGFALAALAYLSDWPGVVLAGAVAEGAGLIWLVAVSAVIATCAAAILLRPAPDPDQ